MKKLIALIFVMFFAFGLAGCGKGPTDIKLTSVKSIINIGDSVQIVAEISPEAYKDEELTWSTSSAAIATVDNNGEVIGIGVGTATITAVAENGVKGTKKIQVKEGILEVYPDLGGYEIRIAQAMSALGDFDPNLDTYTQSNKQARLDAWAEVEELFNCTFNIVSYPADADWGPPRWNYIINQARLGVSDYDFYTVPDGKIPDFVEANALLDIGNWYIQYGKNLMDTTYITSGSYNGKQYSIAEGSNNVYNVMYYNYGLWEAINRANPDLKEPAELFLAGEWTYSKFKDYCIAAQEALKLIYGAAGTAKDASQEYYSMSGYDSYWWIGLSSTDGEPLADIEKFEVNFETPTKVSAINTLKDLYNSGVVDPTQSVDGAVASWKAGKSLFNTGDIWFVRDSTRWGAADWGAGTTNYCYVPWPMPDNTTLSEYKVTLGGTATWVMPVGRDYSLYGAECSAENIYYAVQKMWQLTKEYHEDSDTYDPIFDESNAAEKVTDSDKSKEALIYVRNLIKDTVNKRAFYDPLSNNDNPVASLYSNYEGSITYAVRNYIRGTYGTWAEAAAVVVPNIKEALRKAFLS